MYVLLVHERHNLCFPLFIAGNDTQKLADHLSTCSALQLAVQQIPEYTNRWKNKERRAAT